MLYVVFFLIKDWLFARQFAEQGSHVNADNSSAIIYHSKFQISPPNSACFI
jgi:hypothetical protein